MNYEKKYLKYKNKYLQLKNIQLGGLIVEWPANISEIKLDNIVKILNIKLKDGINPKDIKKYIDIKRLLDRHPFLTVIRVSDIELILKDEQYPGTADIRFNIDIFKNVQLNKLNMDSFENVRKFTEAKEATVYDNQLSDGRISNANVRRDGRSSGLHEIPSIGKINKDVKTDILTSYLLTCDPPIDVNGIDSWGCTPIYSAAINNSTNLLKILIDFGGDRTIKSGSSGDNSYLTPLDIAIKENNQEAIEVLTKYFPTEEEKLDSQLACKQRVDAYFRDKGHPRFKQAQIDLKFQSIEAVKNSKLELLEMSLPYVDLRMAVSLTLVAIEREQTDLMGCLLEKLAKENVFEVITDEKSVEPLLLSGIDPNFKKPPADIVSLIDNSRILSYIKMLHHKFIFLDYENIYEMAKTFMEEGLK